MIKASFINRVILYFCIFLHVSIKDQHNEGGVRKRLRLDDKENGGIVHRDQMVPKAEGKPNCQEKMYYLDASKEGNVARFMNVSIAAFSKLSVVCVVLTLSSCLTPQHSCNPNLFVQNVFVDTHDPKFPVIAFFTSK